MDILSTWDPNPIIAPGYNLLECRLWSVFDMLPQLLIEYDWYLQSATPMTKKACLIIHRSYLRAPTTSIYINLGIKEEKSIKWVSLWECCFLCQYMNIPKQVPCEMAMRCALFWDWRWWQHYSRCVNFFMNNNVHSTNTCLQQEMQSTLLVGFYNSKIRFVDKEHVCNFIMSKIHTQV